MIRLQIFSIVSKVATIFIKSILISSLSFFPYIIDHISFMMKLRVFLV
jgi:hypothetical protein